MEEAVSKVLSETLQKEYLKIIGAMTVSNSATSNLRDIGKDV